MSARRGQVEAIISILGEDKVTALIASIGEKIEDAGKKTDKVAGKTSKYTSAVGAVGKSWAGVTVGIDSITNLVGKASTMLESLHGQAKLGAQELGLERRFMQLTKKIGGAGNAMAELTKASYSGLAKADIQRIANTALTAGVKLGDVTKLFSLSAKVASATGKDLTETTQEVVKGIVEQSDSVFVANGIMTDFGQVVAKAAHKQGLIPDLMNRSERAHETAKDAVDKFNKAFGGFEIGEAEKKLNKFSATLKDLATATRIETLEEANLAPQLAKVRDVMSDLTSVRERSLSVEERRMGNSAQEAVQSAIRADVDSRRIEHAEKLIELMKRDDTGISKLAVGIKLTEEAAAKAAATDMTRADAKEHLIKHYRLEEYFMPKAREDEKALAAAMNLGNNTIKQRTLALLEQRMAAGEFGAYRAYQAAKDAVAAENAASVESKRTEAAKKAFDKILQHRSARASQAAAEADYAASIGAYKDSMARYQEVLDNLPPIHSRTAQQAEIAANAEARLAFLRDEHAGKAVDYKQAALEQIAAQDRQRESTFDLEMALADQSAQMGRSGSAAKHFRNALAIVDHTAPYTTGMLDRLAGAAGTVNSKLAESLKTQIVFLQAQTALQKAMPSLFGDPGKAQARLDDARKQLAALAKKAVKKRYGRAPGAGGAKAQLTDEQKRAKALNKMKDNDWISLIPGGPAIPRTGSPFYKFWEKEQDALHKEQKKQRDKRKREHEKYITERIEAIKASKGLDTEYTRAVSKARELRESIEKLETEGARAEGDKRSRILADITQKRGELERHDLLMRGKYSTERIKIMNVEGAETKRVLEKINSAAMSHFSNAASFAGDSAGQWAKGIASATPIVTAQIDSFISEIDRMGDANNAMAAAFNKGGPSMIAASGKVIAGFVGDQQTQAAIMGAMEAAASISSFAILGGAGIKSGILHGLSSAMYFSIAGKGKKGGGGRGSSGKGPQQIVRPPTGQQAQAANQITLNVSGTIVGNDQQAARELADMLKKEMKWSGALN